ncbi:hypothetical protein [Pseudonocardia acaciae]|uniref:hypothetical protein n=1 Tax=Pseudonocardia acaciae TaxID=551276 RepID=UPI0012EED3EC|nr:hypothetical protein [Pseudonocardia acaciae]
MTDRGGHYDNGWSPGGHPARHPGPYGPPPGASFPPPVAPYADGPDRRRSLRALWLSLAAFGLLLVVAFGLLLVALVTGMAAWAWISVGMSVLAGTVLVGTLVRVVWVMARRR